jgi:hypothetical protein
MKKILLLCIIALLIVSCDDSSNDISMKVINLTVASSDWKESLDQNGLNRYYSAHFSMPEITTSVYNNGSVITYIMFTGAQQNLPYVQHYQDAANAFWTTTIDADYLVGGLNVFVTSSDFAAVPPGAMNFRVVITN